MAVKSPHWPFGKQTSRPLQRFWSEQSRSVPTQFPALQVSFSVHGLPSLHVPLCRGGCTQPDWGSQLSVVQSLPSSQSSESWVHAWPTHCSLIVQALKSAQSALVVQHPETG